MDKVWIEQLKDRISLAELVGQRVRLQRKGREYVGLCPFHNEKTPSFNVVEEKNFYHCFGCGSHGDALSWMMEIEGVSFREALETLAGRCGMQLPALSAEETKASKLRHSLHEVLELACRYYMLQLQARPGEPARVYLEKRGLESRYIEAFRLGYAPDDNPGAFTGWFAKEGVEVGLLEQAGLVFIDERARPRLRFRNRVMFPIGDSKDRVIAFGGRLLGEGAAKYINSPETPLFSKGHELYNRARAQANLPKGQQPVLVEGYMDVLGLEQAGITGAVAPLGTAVTPEQLAILWKIHPAPILCFDGDTAGRRAALRACERALPVLNPGFGLYFCFLPEGEDPDSFVKAQGLEAFREVVARARPLHELLWQQEYATLPLDTPEARAGLEKRLMDHADHIADKAVQNQYRRSFRDLLWQSTRAKKKTSGVQEQQTLPAPKIARQMLSRRFQQILLVTLCHHPALLDEVEGALMGIPFDKDLDKTLEILQKYHRDFFTEPSSMNSLPSGEPEMTDDCQGKIQGGEIQGESGEKAGLGKGKPQEREQSLKERVLAFENSLENQNRVFSSLLADRKISLLAPFAREKASFDEAQAGVRKMLDLHHVTEINSEISALKGNKAEFDRRLALRRTRDEVLAKTLNETNEEKMERPE